MPQKSWLTLPKQFFLPDKKKILDNFFSKKDHNFVILIQFCSKHFDWCSPNSLICFSTDEVNTSNEYFSWEDIQLFVFLLQLCSKSFHWFLPNCFRTDQRDTLNERFSEEIFFCLFQRVSKFCCWGYPNCFSSDRTNKLDKFFSKELQLVFFYYETAWNFLIDVLQAVITSFWECYYNFLVLIQFCSKSLIDFPQTAFYPMKGTLCTILFGEKSQL